MRECHLSMDEINDLTLYQYKVLTQEISYYYQEKAGKKANRGKDIKVNPENTFQHLKALGVITNG